jgi:hypothetical protein
MEGKEKKSLRLGKRWKRKKKDRIEEKLSKGRVKDEKREKTKRWGREKQEVER